MSFWAVESNTQEENLGTFEMGGGSIEPIPAKTQVLAYIDEAKWDTYNNDTYISLRWNIVKPVEYKNRKIFQKLKVNETDSKKRDKAKKMLMAIDHNAKGGLMASGKEPDNLMLTSKLCNKMMVIMLQIWEIEDSKTGDMKRGNWVSAVSPKNAADADRAVEVVRETKSRTIQEEADDAFGADDSLGF